MAVKYYPNSRGVKESHPCKFCGFDFTSLAYLKRHIDKDPCTAYKTWKAEQ